MGLQRNDNIIYWKHTHKHKTIHMDNPKSFWLIKFVLKHKYTIDPSLKNDTHARYSKIISQTKTAHIWLKENWTDKQPLSKWIPQNLLPKEHLRNNSIRKREDFIVTHEGREIHYDDNSIPFGFPYIYKPSSGVQDKYLYTQKN